ncbi:MAG: YbaK/EbsC family protein [Desulfobacterales bacterium]|nr:YbaK/EbsC family protein [Desulfobacterales bacterium]MDD4392004.1 YbaK/EbsC family protein [Desulfobacterales bacterium]
MSTRAVKILKQKNVVFEIVKYDHKEKGAAFAASATGFPLAQTIKTLVVDLGNRSYCMALMSGMMQLDLKKVAFVFGVKNAKMADPATAQRLTGYLIGGIGPFGSKQNLPVVMEITLMAYETVLINAGQRGTLLKMSPNDIAANLNCRISPIASI